MGSATSARSGIIRNVRRCRFGPALDDRLQMALRHRQNQVGVANELLGERLRFVPRQVEPLLAHHLHRFGRRRTTGRCRDAGRHHRRRRGLPTRRASSSRLLARLSRMSSSAIGLRHVLPVQTNEHHDAGQPLQRRFADDALAEDLELIVRSRAPPTTAGRSGRSVVEHQRHIAVEILDDFLGGDGIGLPAAVRAGEHDRTRSIRSTSCDMSLAGTRRPIGAVRRDDIAHRLRQLSDQTFPMLVVDDQRHRPGPAAAREPAGERRHIGHEVRRFLGTLDRQRERLTRSGGPSPCSSRSTASGRQALAARP